MKSIASGAEATIYKNEGLILKDRVKKNYRHPKLDEDLRKSRTRRESKILRKLKNIAPAFISSDSVSKIEMEFIDGQLMKNILDTNTSLSKEIGKIAGILHDKNIIHGDLTTSNIILDKENQVRFIDFGLSFTSHKEEDKAVDLHLFREAVESKHYKYEKEIWKGFLEGYNPHNKKAILKRLEQVEKRGRNKEKY